jgi:hypothetical protein
MPGFFGPAGIGGRCLVQTLDLSANPHPRKGPREFGPVHAIWFVPALAIAAVLAIPVAFVASTVQKKREQSFKKRMKAAGRIMERRDFEQVLQEGRGTVIVESHSLKGPFRWWWTGENLYEICPFPLVSWLETMPSDEHYRPLAEWCRGEYTNIDQGRALLVDLRSPEGGVNIDRTALRSAQMKWFEVAPPERLRHYRQ